jgi:hypothetical protein
MHFGAAASSDETLRSTPKARFSEKDTGGAFYSSITPADKRDLVKVGKLSTLDPLMRGLKEREPMIASVYFNSWDSYNRIYPWIQTNAVSVEYSDTQL